MILAQMHSCKLNLCILIVIHHGRSEKIFNPVLQHIWRQFRAYFANSGGQNSAHLVAARIHVWSIPCCKPSVKEEEQWLPLYIIRRGTTVKISAWGDG